MTKKNSNGEYQAPEMYVIDLHLDEGLCQSSGSTIILPNSSSDISMESFETDDEYGW